MASLFLSTWLLNIESLPSRTTAAFRSVTYRHDLSATASPALVRVLAVWYRPRFELAQSGIGSRRWPTSG